MMTILYVVFITITFIALKSKADPPRIQAELVRVLEPLGSV